MGRRKKHETESYENAEGFQIEDMEGNAVLPEDEDDEHDPFWDDDDEEGGDDNGHFNDIAESNDWEEGYDY